jgi:hypothetical protein
VSVLTIARRTSFAHPPLKPPAIAGSFVARPQKAEIHAVLINTLVRRRRTRRLVAAARLDEANERRIADTERAHLAPSLPAVTAALAIVAMAAAVHEPRHDPEFARGAETRAPFV